MNNLHPLYPLLAILLLAACQNTETADLLISNADIVTLDPENPAASAIAIKGNRILHVGTNKSAKAYISDATEILRLDGQFVMPGFIEGHGHYASLGFSLLNLNFLHSKSWEEIVAMVAERAQKTAPGVWIEGRGWHQEKWLNPPDRQLLGYPYHDALSAVSPNNPVILYHASGHGLFANQKAMEAAGITSETPSPVGGEIVRDSRGDAIGVFEENAMEPIREAHKAYLATLSEEEQTARWYKAIQLAQQECLSKGITSFQDAGAKYFEIERYEKMARDGQLDLRLWVMLRHSYKEMKDRLDGFPIINLGDHFFSCRAIKSEVDGALGSFGAWLLTSYDDKPGFVGQNTTTLEEVSHIAELAYQHDMQLCVHAIGDRANREVLNIMEKAYQRDQKQKDRRWRIEHAQHLHPDDIKRFGQLGIIASMQGVHCTSDAPFVVKRLGEERSRGGAYAWRALLDSGANIANGTDAPVEDVDPLASFYASVTRKRTDSGLEFFPEQRMSRAEALHSYTLGNAYAAFEEKDKGSLEAGKLADITILSNNLLQCSDEEILETEVLYTLVGGQIKYRKK